jgi:hypothetical protein
MIIDDKVKIKLNSKTIRNYIQRGYVGKIGDEIEVKIKDLTKGSHAIINTKCDICGYEKQQMYKTYNYSIQLSGEYHCFSCARKDAQRTCVKKYGGISPMCSKKVLKKREQGFLKKYGYVTNLMCEETKEKIRKTNLLKYGCENVSQNEKIKQKKKDTCLLNHGVVNPLKNSDIFFKQQVSSYKCKEYNGVFYRGTYELDFLIKYNDKYNITNGISVEYIYNGENKIYHPDFYIEEFNLIVEIKSDYTYGYNVDMNESKKKSCLDKGYNFIFIINKDYTELNKIL